MTRAQFIEALDRWLAYREARHLHGLDSEAAKETYDTFYAYRESLVAASDVPNFTERTLTDAVIQAGVLIFNSTSEA